MAAYAALVSLMNTIDHIRIHPLLCNCIDKKQMESLSVHLSFLLDFVESNHSHGAYNNEAELLESQIARAAHAAEDAIESHVVDQIHSDSISLFDLQTTIHGMDSVKEKVLIVKEEGIFKDDVPEGPTYSLPNPSTSSSNGKSKMVRFDEELVQLSDAFTEQQLSLQIIPIVGMGGIGKTTLASYFYDSSFFLDNFDFRAWVTIPQEYNVNEIFSKFLSRQSSQSAGELGQKTEQQLAQELYRSLIGRKYLIILDDIWSLELWEKIKSSFPDNNNGSRIILTTRQSNVASHFVSSYFSKKLLDEDESWKLFCETAFPQEGCCPLELEEIGKNIAKNCKGLPLLILVIGGLLRKSYMSQELWEIISKDINSVQNLIVEEENLNILSLSYTHLPTHLKPCFIYMGICFPEDVEISVSHLIKLWIFEGFIKPNKTQSLEEIAEGYLKDLVERNLLLVGRLRWNRKIKTCGIHDLLRDLCIKASQKEKFLFSHKKGCILLLKKISEVNFDPLLIWNVQTLKIGGTERFVAPSEIWSMPQLRHVEFAAGINLPEPRLKSQENDDVIVLKNLQTLKKAVNLNLSEEVCKRIPNVKKLNLVYEGLSKSYCYNNLYNIGMLHKLEVLCIDFGDLSVLENTENSDLLRNFKFPASLKKLTLIGSDLDWEDLTMIGSLPNLEVLQLGIGSVRGSEWNPIEGEFLCLKYLFISCFELKYWNAESVHFPVLENLVLNGIFQLDKIPSGIGEIPTLDIIRMLNCSESAAVSAAKILEEQESLGNDKLRVRIQFKSNNEYFTTR